MKAIRRKARRIVWVVFYHGPGSTNITLDGQAAWNNKRAAMIAIARKSDAWNYSVEKYVRAV